MRERLLPLLAYLVAALLASAGSVAAARADSGSPPPYVVIVNGGNSNTSASRKFIADAFLKKTTRWPDGSVIRPVDLPPNSTTRGRFSDEVLNRSVAAVKSYWQQIIFSGRDVPPPELATDDEVVKYVGQHAGAIGYVSSAARLNGVKPLRVD